MDIQCRNQVIHSLLKRIFIGCPNIHIVVEIVVIYNILKIAVVQRIKQYGTLRAIGGEKRQLYFLVTGQVLLLCVIGIPIGLLLLPFPCPPRQ